MKLLIFLLIFITFFSISCDDTEDVKKESCVDFDCGNGKREIKDDKAICICQDGYSGEDCKTDIDDCKNSPCQNGGSCIDGINSYSCKCKENFSGDNCEISFSYCEANPCQNGGNCIEGDNFYRCECLEGYSGDNCEIDLSNCSNLCQWGTIEDDKAYSIAIDSNDNIYIAGVTSGNLEENVNLGDKDLFLTKINSSGEKEWTKQWGTAQKEEAYSMITDSDNNLYITGFTAGALGGTSFGKRDAFLIKFNSAGEIEWTKQWGSADDDYGNSITLDSNNNIYIAGNTSGMIDGVSTAHKRDIFLTKFNSAGENQWTKQWNDDYEWGKGVVVDSNDNIYITGYMGDVISGDIFLSKINSSGEREWIKKWGTDSNDYGNSVTIDSNDNLYITGKTKGTLSNNEEGNFFLTKLDTEGVQSWTKQWGADDGEGKSVAIDSNNSIYVLGTVNLDKNDTNNNISLSKFNSTGTKEWTKEWDKGGNDFGFSVAVNSNDDIFITGFTDGSFDGFTNAGYLDIVLIKVTK